MIKSELRLYYEGTRNVIRDVCALRRQLSSFVSSANSLVRASEPVFRAGAEFVSAIVSLVTSQSSTDINMVFAKFSRDFFAVLTHRHELIQHFLKEIILPLSRHLSNYVAIIESFLRKSAEKEIETVSDLNAYKNEFSQSFRISVLAEKDLIADNVHRQTFIESLYILRVKFASIASHYLNLITPIRSYVESSLLLHSENFCSLEALGNSEAVETKSTDSPYLLYSQSSAIALSVNDSKIAFERTVKAIMCYSDSLNDYSTHGLKMCEKLVSLGKTQHGDDIETVFVSLGESLISIFTHTQNAANSLTNSVAIPLDHFLETEESAIKTRLQLNDERIESAKERYSELNEKISLKLFDSTETERQSVEEARMDISRAYLSAYHSAVHMRRKAFCGFATRLLKFLNINNQSSSLLSALLEQTADIEKIKNGANIFPKKYAELAETVPLKTEEESKLINPKQKHSEKIRNNTHGQEKSEDEENEKEFQQQKREKDSSKKKKYAFSLYNIKRFEFVHKSDDSDQTEKT